MRVGLKNDCSFMYVNIHLYLSIPQENTTKHVLFSSRILLFQNEIARYFKTLNFIFHVAKT